MPRPLAVVGGGVVGLAIARRAAQDGWTVRVHRTADPGASWVAGGMLAPHSEAWPGEERLLQLGLESLRLWHETFLDSLPAEVVTARQSLVVAVDQADAADLKTVGAWLSAQGHPVTPTTTARDMEPLLAQGIRHGFVAETELAVDNRAVVAALAEQCERLGVQWAPPVAALTELDAAETVVIANGIDAPALWPGLAVRPVKGEVLRLRWRRGCLPVPGRVVRARVRGRHVYVVPRADGVVVGATQYEHGRDTAPAVNGVRDLLDDPLTVFTPNTITDGAVLATELAEVRSKGWASVSEELEIGLNAVGVPVRDSSGTTIAALSVSGPAYRLDPSRFDEVAAMTMLAADQISRRLGFTG